MLSVGRVHLLELFEKKKKKLFGRIYHDSWKKILTFYPLTLLPEIYAKETIGDTGSDPLQGCDGSTIYTS